MVNLHRYFWSCHLKRCYAKHSMSPNFRENLSYWAFSFNPMSFIWNKSIILIKNIRTSKEFYSWVSWKQIIFHSGSVTKQHRSMWNQNIQFLFPYLIVIKYIFYYMFWKNDKNRSYLSRKIHQKTCFFGYADCLLIWTTYPNTVWWTRPKVLV